ncbi:hypothetical protein BCR36DRAFT_580500 [Piromyces finnis]|uniref:Uncharacterized protein n=1 Tax=Piromyces finnis TaxID=1754191 RepID=A0A1Y1VJR8_9FUNG|nr:hypothetical protein BCR36DRAFT_580500 [Piromyces finnis]|eukprot:ORX57951.1 hypothetical protein BCR36DRAFT_580500 [Piromyces finnis]
MDITEVRERVNIPDISDIPGGTEKADIQEGEIQESKGFYKLNWVQRIGFGAGDLAQNFIFQTVGSYILFFYTDVYILTGDTSKAASAAGTLMLIQSVIDVIWSPIVGTFVIYVNIKIK